MLGPARDPADPHGHRMQTLRTELLLRREFANQAEVVCVASPCAGEGRTRLATELALAIAQTGLATLLVDADLRRPGVHDLFGVGNNQGLATSLEHNEPPPLLSVRGLRHMSVLTAGTTALNPLELLSSRRFAELVDQWREQFGYVIMDTSPVSQFPDALAVANLTGNVLVISRAQHTPFIALENMLRQVGSTQSRVLGAVISHH
jgi:receptor protein-tyrosine kinase